MKKIYGLMGLTGFILMIGGAGGADTTSFMTSFYIMTAGLALILLSLMLVKSHNIRMRKKRYLYMKRKAEHEKNVASVYIPVERKTPSGISAIISGTLNSPELC